MNQSERSNFYKSITGIGIATQSACHVFEQYLTSKKQSLEDFINHHRHDICHLCYNKVKCPHCTTGYQLPYEKVLCLDQLDDLFDSGSKLPCHILGNLPKFYCCKSRIRIQIKDLDLTLIRCLLVNFCQELFLIDCLKAGTFEDFLNKSKHDIFHMWQVKQNCCQCHAGYTPCEKRKLSEYEWKRLFNNSITPCNFHTHVSRPSPCSVAASSGIMLQQLNSKLRITLLDFCELKKDLEKLIKLRNNIQGHRAAREMTHMADAEFNDRWMEIEDVTCNLIRHGIQDTYIATQIEDEQIRELVTLKNKILDDLEEKRKQRIALTELEIEGQMKRNNFVKTRAVEEAIKIVQSQNMVVLTGSAGSGKSATAIYLLRHFQMTKNYQPLKISTFTDLSILVKPNTDEPVIVLLEDIFGRTNYTYVENSDRNVLGELGTCMGNKLKVIITIRTTIMKSCMSLFYTSNVFCGLHVVDLSRDFQLVKAEKKSVLERYLELNNITVSECGNCMDDQLQTDTAVTINNKVIDEIVHLDTVSGFPENCRLFTTIRCFTRLGIHFFRHPTISLRNEIDALRRADGNDNISFKLKSKFTTLVYMLLSNDVLRKKSLDFCKVQDIFKSVNGGGTIMEHQFIDAADDMIDQYVTYSSLENAYYFQHRIIAEAVMISYSKCNISQVISMLNPDFIAEMVKPDCYIEKEGEVVFKIPSNNYRHLATVIKDLLLLKSIDGCFIEYILSKSEIFENVEFLYAIVETFECLFKPKDFLSYEDIELKKRACKLLDLTFKKTASLNNIDCLHFIWKIFAKKCITTPSFVLSMCSVFIRFDKEKYQKELLEWMVLNSNQMFIEQCLEKTCCYQSHFLETLVDNEALISKLNEVLYSPGDNNVQQIIINHACQLGNYEIFLIMMRRYGDDINLGEIFLRACSNDFDDITIVEWLIDHYDFKLLNMQQAFENIYKFWNIYKNIIKSILKSSANNDNEFTNKLLIEAFKTGNLESAEFLRQRIDLRTFDIRTAVYMAWNNHVYEIIEWLLEQSRVMQISSQIDEIPVIRIMKWRNLPQSSNIRQVLDDSILSGDYGMDLITEGIKPNRIIALKVFKVVAKSSGDRQQTFVQSCHRTNFNIEGVFLDACKSKNLEVLEMVLNYYDEDTYGQIITKAGEDFYSINFYNVCQFSKLPSVIFQNTPIDFLHKNPGLFPIAVKEGDTETVKIFLNEIDCKKLKADEAFGYSLDNRTLQVTKLLLDNFPISDFKISTHLIKVIEAGENECFQLILQNVNIDLLDINELLNVIITNGKCKGLLLDVLQRNISKLILQSKLQNKFFLALKNEDLEVFEFLLRNVDHENIDAKKLVIKALQQGKFNFALLLLRKVSVNELNMKNEIKDALINSISLEDKTCARRILMNFPNVNFRKILTSATKDGDVSIINDIIMKRDEDFTFEIKEYMWIAIHHRQPIALKFFMEHSSYICNLDVKSEFIAFAEKGKTRICELYLKVIDTYNTRFTLTSKDKTVMNDEIFSLFELSFVDDHIEHQRMSRLHLIDLLDLMKLLELACCALHECDFYNNEKCCASMILINFSEDIVDGWITIRHLNRFYLQRIFSHVCHKCKKGKQYSAIVSKFEKRYGTLFHEIS
ncbi:uncharacterized protein LOC127732119 [Mytilus californianus]|uniref:uncharacterized protein LOC127732119 n=1 Tax=Mytilus californianus TaxID=6549 RepID=UPI002246309B|nr:uncharacterized protein LOC127732119 [Mytilus californianus]XP_052097137.1 uncharacterized protein LOC127732119 [Mytilus californianus]